MRYAPAEAPVFAGRCRLRIDLEAASRQNARIGRGVRIVNPKPGSEPRTATAIIRDGIVVCSQNGISPGR